jgi:hypothetical protein
VLLGDTREPVTVAAVEPSVLPRRWRLRCSCRVVERASE